MSALTVVHRPGYGYLFVGSIPMALAYESCDGSPLTDAQAAAITQCGPGFARPKVRAVRFLSRASAVAAAAALGVDVMPEARVPAGPFNPTNGLGCDSPNEAEA